LLPSRDDVQLGQGLFQLAHPLFCDFRLLQIKALQVGESPNSSSPRSVISVP
jgi:hypothetical protein